MPRSADADLNPTAPGVAHAPTLGPGAEVARFTIERLLGAGGMGTVYEARDPHLDRAVAIKVLPGDGRRRDLRLRLVREAQALAQLQHPNVVGVHEVGVDGDRVFIAMELVDGVTLGDHLKARPHGWREVVALFVQAGRGLAAAHAKGLIHRDFKPSNVLVDRDGRVRVGDFGLARLASSDAAESTAPGAAADPGGDRTTIASDSDTDPPPPSTPTPASERPALDEPLTAAGALLGTPRYMAPEQYARLPATARSDQYSFCVALWEALVGEHPYAAGNDLGGLAATVPGARPRPAPRGRAPRAVVQLVSRGLRLDPAGRHPSMAALVDALEAIPLRRRRLAVGAAGAAIAAAAALIAATVTGGDAIDCATSGRDLDRLWTGDLRAGLATRFAAARPHGADTAGRVAAALDGWTAQWRDARVDACRATHERGAQSAELLDRRAGCLDRGRLALSSLLAGFATVDGLTVDNALAAASALPPPGDCDAARVVAAAPPRTDPAARAVEADLEASQAAWNLGRKDEASQRARAARVAAEALGDSALQARALAAVAERDASLAAAEARALFEAAQVAAARAQDRALEVDVVLTALTRAGHHEDSGWMAALLPSARASVAASGRPEHLRRLLNRESQVLVATGKSKDLAGLCDRLAKVEGVLDREVSECRCRASNALHTADAVATCEAHLRAHQTYVGEQHPSTAMLLHLVAAAHQSKGAHDHALELLTRALAVADAAYGRRSLEAAKILSTTALSLNNLNRHEEAQRRYEEVLEIYGQIQPGPTPASVRVRMYLAEELLHLGQREPAIATAAEAMRLADIVHDPQNRILVSLLATYALVAEHTGRHRLAFEAYQRAEGIARAHYGDASSMTLLTMLGQAQALMHDGDVARAVELAEKAAASLPDDGTVAPRQRAYALAMLGEAVSRSGDRVRGRKHLLEARAIYASLGPAGAPQVREVDKLIREVAGRR